MQQSSFIAQVVCNCLPPSFGTMRVGPSLAILFSSLSCCVSKPVVELPRELSMDVNKLPVPIVNVIAERASPAAGERAKSSNIALALSGAGVHERGALEESLAEQHTRLERLKSLRASFQ